jgi:hypothetical protein
LFTSKDRGFGLERALSYSSTGRSASVRVNDIMKKTLSTVTGHITGVQSMEQNG